jgi:hypothetical protein
MLDQSLRTLESSLGTQGTKELIQVMIKILPSYVEEMKVACINNDFNSLKSVAHKFKSAGGILALTESIDLSRALTNASSIDSDQIELVHLISNKLPPTLLTLQVFYDKL